jgi:hypothetical protein
MEIDTKNAIDRLERLGSSCEEKYKRINTLIEKSQYVMIIISMISSYFKQLDEKILSHKHKRTSLRSGSIIKSEVAQLESKLCGLHLYKSIKII